LSGANQPTDSGNYAGKFSLLNQSDSGDDDDDNDIDNYEVSIDCIVFIQY